MRKPLVVQLELDVEALRRELRALDAAEGHGAGRAELAEREARLSERERRLEELERRAAAVEERERVLADREREVDDLGRRAAAVEERETLLADRERELDELGRRAVERERAVARREADAMTPTAPVWDADRRQLEEDIEVRRARLEAEIELRWDEIDGKEEDLDEREQRVVRKEQELVAYVSQVQDELLRREQRWLQQGRTVPVE